MIRSLSSACLLLLCSTVLASSLHGQADAKAKVEQLLKQSAKEFLAVIDNVSDEQWNFKGSGMRHSIGEEAEHVALAEQDLQKIVQKALQAKADPMRAAELKGKEGTVRKLMLEATKGAENFRPAGRLNSKLEVLEYFGMAHKKLLQLLADAQELETHIYKHPSKDYGELTGLQWFYYIAYHKMRHSKQIEAIKSNADYPGRVRKAAVEFPAEPDALLLRAKAGR